MLHPENRNGKEKDGDDGKNAGGGFERPARHDAPMAAGKMLEHEQAERAQRQSENEHERDEIRMEKSVGVLVAVEEDANAAGHYANNARPNGALLQAADAFRRHV